MPGRCERREMPRSPHEKRVRATIMEDKACYEYHVLSHEAIFVTPLRRTMRIRGQTTHYADNALFDERKSRSLTFGFSLPSPPVTVPTFLRKKGGTVKRALHMRISRATGYLFFSETEIRENCSLLINISRHAAPHVAVKLNSESEFYF